MLKPLQSLLNFLSFLASVNAVTIHYVPGQEPFRTASADPATYTGNRAYSPLVLSVPPLPEQKPATAFNLEVLSGANPSSISMPIPGNFYGFSIELSVINQVIGHNASHLQVPTLNLLSNIVKRAGSVQIRVGGNTQERAVLVDSLENNRILMKTGIDANTKTGTPTTAFTREALYMLNNVSALVNAKWYLGIPFNDTNWRLQIATEGLRILGDNLLGLQAGNEPDQYLVHKHREEPYTPNEYVGEFKLLVAAMAGEEYAQIRHMLLGPSLSDSFWHNQEVWDTGYVDIFNDNLKILTTEKYPDNNCDAVFDTGIAPKNPQDELPNYLSHSAVTKLTGIYTADTAYAQMKGKPFIMFETNTASCSGFPGISDAFASSLWGLDYGLSMAANNFSGALLHFGGQASLYNPWTAPPSNETRFHQFTVGPIYYSTLVMAEALGPSNTTQVWDLGLNEGNDFTPGYAMYQQGKPVRLGFFNYLTDPTGGSTYTVSVIVRNVNQADETPQSVKVKYLRADSTTQKGNITWAGQTFGMNFDSDGRPIGEEVIETVNCDGGICKIVVPAPSFAMVFLTDAAINEADAPTQTYSTTALTNTQNTATVDSLVLQTSNGHKGLNGQSMGSTSPGSNGAGGLRVSLSGTFILAAFISGVLALRR